MTTCCVRIDPDSAYESYLQLFLTGVITTLRFFVRQTGVSLIFGEAD